MVLEYIGKIRLVRQRRSVRVESMVEGVFEKIHNRRHVDVGKALEAPWKVAVVVVGAKYTTKLLVEHGLCQFPKLKQILKEI